MKCNVLILKLKEAVIRKLSTQWQEGYKSKKKKKKTKIVQNVEVLYLKKKNLNVGVCLTLEM